MKGDANGNYRPNDNVTRAEFATFLVRGLALPNDATPSNFQDVHEGDWYYDAVNRASYYQIIKGDAQGYFHPNDKINRQQMAVMLKRAFERLGIHSSVASLNFADQASIASWAYVDVQHVVSVGLIVGQPDNSFAPLARATRGEAATVIYRLLKADEVGKQYTTTNYPYNYGSVVTTQANNKPKVDGAGVFTATEALVSYYVNPSNFQQGSPEFYQFLKLSSAVKNLDAAALNEKVLYNKGNFVNTGDAFVQAGVNFDMNAIYILSHAFHETANGTSPLANGIEVGLDKDGKPTMVTDANRASLTAIKKTYNVYGIGAIDADPNKYGSERAYKDGWFTITDAIIGGAQFVKEKYIGMGQDTLYKMRWNPDNPSVHQYATHVMWSIIQARKIADLYTLTGADTSTLLIFDVPAYENQPASSPLPSIENQYAVNTALKGAVGQPTVSLNMRTYPNTTVASSIITMLPIETQITVIGENGGWYKVNVNGQVGWVYDDYVKLTNVLKITNTTPTLNVRSEPSTSSTIIGTVNANAYIVGVLDENNAFIKNGEWYKVVLNGQPGWVNANYVVKK